MISSGPVRKIKPTRFSVSGLFCFRGQRMIAYESTLERDLLRRLVFNKRVLDIQEQPIRIPWRDTAGRLHFYTPDFLVHWRSMGEFWRKREPPWLVEVKPRALIRLNWVRWHPKFRAAARFAAERGWRFRLLDETRIRDVVLSNSIMLERHAAYRYTLDQDAALLAAIDFDGGTTIGKVLDQHFPSSGMRSNGMSALCRLIAAGVLGADLTQPLNDEAEIWMDDNDD